MAPTLESRLAQLEAEVAELRSIVTRKKQFRRVEDTFGMMAKYPEYDEIVQLGAEYRQRDRDLAAAELSKEQS